MIIFHRAISLLVDDFPVENRDNSEAWTFSRMVFQPARPFFDTLCLGKTTGRDIGALGGKKRSLSLNLDTLW